MPKFEYKHVSSGAGGPDETKEAEYPEHLSKMENHGLLKEMLNKMGKDGYILCGEHTDDVWHELHIFKRPTDGSSIPVEYNIFPCFIGTTTEDEPMKLMREETEWELCLIYEYGSGDENMSFYVFMRPLKTA